MHILIYHFEKKNVIIFKWVNIYTHTHTVSKYHVNISVYINSSIDVILNLCCFMFAQMSIEDG